MDIPLDARRTAAGAAARHPARGAADRGLVVVLHAGRVARMGRPRGVRLAVEAGRVWITVAGCDEDVFLGPGEATTVDADGLLVVESDGRVPAVLRLDRVAAARRGAARRAGAARFAALARCAAALAGAAAVAARRAWRERAERRALAELDEHALRDVGAPDALCDRLRAERAAVARDGPRRTIDRCTW